MSHKRTIIYFICLIITTFTIKAQNGNHFTHTVSKGQTLYSIARMYEVTVDEIIALNPECAQKLAIGYKLKIAQKTKSADATAPSSDKRYHTIQSGETLYRLGQMYGITPQAICAANP
jgi:LysM repeat protein